MNENIYITFQIDIHETQYYGGNRGQGRCELAIPRELINALDIGNIFEMCLKAALVDYDNKEENNE